ncbi:response regulator transcription factor [Anaerosporobacter sp.]|uniref:response regulator transcription factor n=1 Tax=Anaerosporobacter sp. TaxID=1872529 RepID=UPI00286F2997|nr:response regulator [Anaerosporobacter sp.]
MYKVVIIDDEQTVREGIRTLLSWEEMGFTIVEEASDGEDGLAVVLKRQPDMVLVDVRMPAMTGLELIEAAREAGYKGHFLILTGYSDFEYAKSAISLGVRGYLLKPIDEDELYRYVCDIKSDLDKEMEKKEREGLVQEEKAKNRIKARQNVIYNLLMKQETIEIIEKEIKKFEFDYNYKKFHVIILSNERFYMDEDYKEKTRLILAGLNRYEYLVLGERIALIIKGDTLQTNVAKLEENNTYVKERYGEGFLIVIGQEVTCLRDICYSFECAQYLAGQRFLYGTKNIISMRLLQQEIENKQEDTLISLSDCMEIGDLTGIEKCIHGMLEKCRYRLMKESQIKITVINNTILLLNNLKSSYESQIEGVIDIDSYTKEVNQTKSIAELESLIVEYSKKISEKLGNAGTDSIVKKMDIFIQKNYSKDLKLEAIAKMFGYNSAYLGKTYKKVTGESFNTALDKVRIENAKRLLQDTNLKVYQVSEKVGYYNIDYFYSKFKKYVGMTPKEFKKNEI